METRTEKPGFIASRGIYFLLFTVSGFSGLIYESLWSHYLKLFLGHAAYAQSLVLIVFMGGLAIGSWLASRLLFRWRLPILAYAAVEAVIGALALVFHEAFGGVTGAFYASILPHVSDPAAGVWLMWGAAAALMLPQTILLGMTFPLLTAGVIRRYPQDPGGTLAMLYFTNSIGAAIGVLASGFWLIGLLGLPGTLRVAGLLNIALGAVVAWLVRSDPQRLQSAGPAGSPGEAARHANGLLLTAAFVTGVASFIYEIGWIRMLSLVLGSATHAFELMLSAFVAGLAFGGLAIRRRIGNVTDPVRFAAYVQVAMGVMAVISMIVYLLSFLWMASLFNAVDHTDEGYRWFTLGSHGIALAVMFPTTFLAGMTLPIFTHAMMRSGVGERAIGQVYAANTVGGIVGVLFAIHIGMPLLGLKNTIGVGALLDAGLGAGLFLAVNTERRWLRTLRSAGPGLAFILVLVLLFRLPAEQLASGVFRYGTPTIPAESQVLYYRDGKTATVSVVQESGGSQYIATNGKADAAIQMLPLNPPGVDEKVMVMLAALPVAYRPGLRTAAIIGFGSGMTAHTLLASPDISAVDIIEIEPAMVEGARLYGDKVRRAYEDPRSRIRIEDAKAFFAQHHQTYDVIISEPSNPWVSGVANLFSTEFYGRVRNYLNDDGLLVQWIHFYETNDDLVYSILKALAPHYSDFIVFNFGQNDGAIVAKKTGQFTEPDLDRLLAGPMGEEVRRAGVEGAFVIRQMRVGDRASLLPHMQESPAPANSDYYPYVDLNAVRARFRNELALSFR